MGRKTVNFLEDEEIANSVKKCPCLYDKGDKFYKDKRAKKNSWRKVVEEVGRKSEKVLYPYFPFSSFLLFLKLKPLKGASNQAPRHYPFVQK